MAKNRLGPNGVPGVADQPVSAKERLALLEGEQVKEQRLLVQCQETAAKIKESMLIRRGRIDELRRIVNAENAAATKE